MGIRAGILVLTTLAMAACHRDLRPTQRDGRWEVVCPLQGETAPDLLADYADWRPVAETAERVAEGWRLGFRPPRAGIFRLQCRSGSRAAAPAGFDWREDDGFGGENAVGFVSPSDRSGAGPLE